MPTTSESLTESRPQESNATPSLTVNVDELSLNSTLSEAPTKSKHLGRAPLPGFTYNPLLTLPRNMPCPCLSGEKFKRCCLNNLPEVVSLEDAKNYRVQMAKPDLIFLNPHNDAEVRAKIEPALKAELELKELEHARLTLLAAHVTGRINRGETA